MPFEGAAGGANTVGYLTWGGGAGLQKVEDDVTRRLAACECEYAPFPCIVHWQIIMCLSVEFRSHDDLIAVEAREMVLDLPWSEVKAADERMKCWPGCCSVYVRSLVRVLSVVIWYLSCAMALDAPGVVDGPDDEQRHYHVQTVFE